jgi:hypothetical protein
MHSWSEGRASAVAVPHTPHMISDTAIVAERVERSPHRNIGLSGD